jgi:hypothetical protein
LTIPSILRWVDVQHVDLVVVPYERHFLVLVALVEDSARRVKAFRRVVLVELVQRWFFQEHLSFRRP